MRTGTPFIRPDNFKPMRDRHIKVLSVPCPSCGVGIDIHCIRLDGWPSATHLQHPSRRRMAVRADNLARGI